MFLNSSIIYLSGAWEEPIEKWCDSVWSCLYPPSIMSKVDAQAPADSYLVKNYNGKEKACHPMVGEDSAYNYIVTETKVRFICISAEIF